MVWQSIDYQSIWSNKCLWKTSNLIRILDRNLFLLIKTKRYIELYTICLLSKMIRIDLFDGWYHVKNFFIAVVIRYQIALVWSLTLKIQVLSSFLFTRSYTAHFFWISTCSLVNKSNLFCPFLRWFLRRNFIKMKRSLLGYYSCAAKV